MNRDVRSRQRSPLGKFPVSIQRLVSKRVVMDYRARIIWTNVRLTTLINGELSIWMAQPCLDSDSQGTDPWMWYRGVN